MKELTSFHDDIDKRLAIFFGLGAFLVSSLVGLLRGYTLEGFLLQGVVVLILATALGYGYGAWLRYTLKATEPHEEVPQNIERRRTNAETLEEGSVVMPNQAMETVIAEEPGSPSGQIINYTLPELGPPGQPEAVVPEETEELPPPPVPGWLK